MKNLIVTVAMVFALVSGVARGDTETVGGIEWTYTVNAGEATLGINGWDNFALAVATSTVGEVTIPSSLGGCPVTCIGWSSFRTCNLITGVRIPSTVTKIDACAFYGCSSLNGFTVDVANPKYKSANGLLLTKDGTTLVDGGNGGGNLIVPEGVTDIGQYALCDRSGLKTISLPASLSGIGEGAFSCCSDLISFEVAADNETFKTENGLLLSKDGTKLVAGVNGEVTVPSGVTSFEHGAFYGRGRLVSVSMPDSVTNIGYNTFVFCTNLVSVSIPSGLSSLDGSNFMGSGLQHITIPDTVLAIGGGTFQWCTDLTDVDFEGAPPSELSSAGINQDAFIRYNIAYENEWLLAIEECGFVNTVPYTPRKAYGAMAEYVDIIDPSGVFSVIEFADVGTWSVVNSWGTFARWEMEDEGTGERVDVLKARFTTERDALLTFSNYGYGIGVEIDGEDADSAWNGNGYSYVVPDTGEHTLTLTFDNAREGMYTGIGTITVQESPYTFQVAFDARGGSCNESVRNYEYGESYGTLPTPALDGCTFLGWSEDEYGSDYVTAEDVVKFSMSTLYAQWQLDSVAKFLGEDTGITFATLTNVNWSLQTRSGYEWDYQQQKSVYYSKPYLSWYSPSYIRGGVETVVLDAVMSGAGILRIPTTLSGNMNLTLTIDGVVQTNYYVNEGGSYGESRVYVGSYYGSSISTELTHLFSTVGEHHVKLTLNATSDSRTQYGYRNGSVQIGAMRWEAAPTQVVVTFDANGGNLSGQAARTFTVGSTYGSLPTPTRSNCQFLGWYSAKFGGTKFVSTDYVDWTATTLYAHWTSTIEAALGGGVSDAYMSCEGIVSDGNGVVFPVPETEQWGYAISYDTNRYFEVTCEGEVIVSFDWSVDGEFDISDSSAMMKPTFSIDGEEVCDSFSSERGNSVDVGVASYFWVGTNRVTVSALLSPGTHVLRWSADILETYRSSEVRFAVENFKIVEKPVANRETLFDWGKLAYDYLVWKPNNLTEIRDRYTQKINQNGNDYESRIWRALTKLVLLGENTKARQVIGQFGYQITDYTMKPTGEFVGFENAPLSNTVVDEVTPEIVAAIDSALEDVCAIPTDWAGRIEVNPEDYGYSIKTNELWTDEKVYIGLAEVSALRATLEAMRAFVKMAQGYDYEADYIAVSNAYFETHHSQWLSEMMSVAPKAGLVRNLAAMTEAKENFRAALESIKRADSAILNRGDYDTYLFEYDIADAADLVECRKILNQVEASLDATNVIDLTYFADKYDTNGVVRAEIPGGEALRQLYLGALFAGKVTRELAPEAYINNQDGQSVWPHMQSVPDPTIGGLLPDFTLNDVARLYRGNQVWEMSAYLAYKPKVKLDGGKFLAVYGTAERTGDLSYSVAVPGYAYCLRDWSDAIDGSYTAQDMGEVTVAATNGIEYAILFSPDGDMETAAQPITITSAPLPLADGGPYTEIVEGVEITFEVVDGEAWIGTSTEDQGVPEETTGDVIIPATLGGRAVVGIRGFAFFRCKNLSNLIFYGDEPFVEDCAFKNATLKSVLVSRSANWPNPLPDTWNGFAIGYIPALDESIVVTPSQATGNFSFSTALTLDAGASRTIYYTTDGTEPSRESPVYNGPIVLTQTATVRYFAVDDETQDWGPAGSVVLTRVAAESDKMVVTPSVADGAKFVGSQEVTLAAGDGQTVWYTTDGSDPRTSPTRLQYDQAILMEGATTLEYYAVDNATGDWSGVQTATYYLQLGDGGPYVEVVDGIEWRFFVTNGAAYFRGPDVGTNAIPTDTSGAIVIPGELGCCPLVSIGTAAFAGCASITSVTIPCGVTNVESSAFMWCGALLSLTIPEGVTSIGASAFWNCTSLAYVTIPEGVTSIGAGAFYGCTSLTKLVLPNSVVTIGGSGFGVFSGCTSLKKLVLPSGITNIDSSMLSGSSITHLTVPSSVTNINSDAFNSGNFLTTTSELVYLFMEGDAPAISQPFVIGRPTDFSYCENATVYVKKGSYGYGTVPGTWGGLPVRYVEDSVFAEVVDGVAWNYSNDGGHVKLQARTELSPADLVRGALALPESVDGNPITVLGKGFLQGAFAVTSVAIPSTVTEIEASAFRECTRLKEINLPEGLGSIGDNAFRECASLTDVVIPASVTNIGYFAFRDCLRLTNVTLLGIAPRQDLGVYMGVPAFTVISGRLGSETAIVYAGITNKADEITVPESWLDELAVAHDAPAGKKSYQQAFEEKFGSDLKAALTKPTGKHDLHGNPLQVWQDYVAGTDPLDEEDTFTATVTIEDGIPKVRWEPELPPERAAMRKYTTYGATALGGGWTDVSSMSDADRKAGGYQFFKVTVEIR